MKYFSLFSGIGGFELGIDRANKGRPSNMEGVSSYGDQSNSPNELWGAPHPICIGFSEIDKYATQVYKNHFNHKEYGDVSAIDWSSTENFDLLVGGFPCQAFSVAGKRRGFDDTRGTLFFEIAKCLREKQPRLFLLENVKGLLSHDKGKTFGVILNTLDELGYDLQWQVLNSKNFGVPQNRERVFIVGHLRGTRKPEVFPIRETTTGAIKVSKRGKSQQYIVHKETGIMSALCAGTHGNAPHLTKTELLSSQIRRLTPTECERLQGFPDGWTEGISDTQRYKCLGNAVTVNVIEAIMTRILHDPDSTATI